MEKSAVHFTTPLLPLNYNEYFINILLTGLRICLYSSTHQPSPMCVFFAPHTRILWTCSKDMVNLQEDGVKKKSAALLHFKLIFALFSFPGETCEGWGWSASKNLLNLCKLHVKFSQYSPPLLPAMWIKRLARVLILSLYFTPVPPTLPLFPVD